MNRVLPAGRSLLLVDTNLLLLLVVGSVDRSQVERFKRTRKYTAEDFDLLAAYVDRFEGLLVTPNVLTEVSNLAGQLADPLRSRVFGTIAVLAVQLAEEYVPSSTVAREPDFVRLGLTDISILFATRERASVLTDDLPLYLRLAGSGIAVENFNHIRTEAWGE